MSEYNNQHIDGDEIDLVELLKKVYKEKKLIFKCSIIAAIFGVVFALFQPNQYTSSTTFIPQLRTRAFSTLQFRRCHLADRKGRLAHTAHQTCSHSRVLH